MEVILAKKAFILVILSLISLAKCINKAFETSKSIMLILLGEAVSPLNFF